jgi:hypothetical protein
VQVKRLIAKRIRTVANGIHLVADVNADVSVNVAERRVPASRQASAAEPEPTSRSDAGANERGKEIR